MPLKNGIDLSIIVVSWNAKALLRECLQSIQNTIKETTYEVLVIDNNSSDGSAEMIADQFPTITLIPTGSNLGFARANNIGIERSVGRYICLINSDVKLLKKAVDLLVSYMEQKSVVGIIGPKVLNPDFTVQTNCKIFPTQWNVLCRALGLDTLFPRLSIFAGSLASLTYRKLPCSVEALSGCFLLTLREALNEVGPIDESFFMYYEDVDWCKRFRLAGWEVIYFPQARIIHHGGASSSNIPTKSYLHLKWSSFIYWEKYYGKRGLRYVYLITYLHEMMRILRSALLLPILCSKRSLLIRKINTSIVCIKWLFKIHHLGELSPP